MKLISELRNGVLSVAEKVLARVDHSLTNDVSSFAIHCVGVIARIETIIK